VLLTAETLIPTCCPPRVRQHISASPQHRCGCDAVLLTAETLIPTCCPPARCGSTSAHHPNTGATLAHRETCSCTRSALLYIPSEIQRQGLIDFTSGPAAPTTGISCASSATSDSRCSWRVGTAALNSRSSSGDRYGSGSAAAGAPGA